MRPADHPRSRGTAVAIAVVALIMALMNPARAATTAPTLSSISVHYGPTAGDTRVIVHGHGFTGVRAIYFGVHRAPYFRVSSGTGLIVRSPKVVNSQAVHVVVHAAAGETAKVPAAVFHFVGPPRVTGLSRPGGTPAGSRTKVFGANFLAIHSVTFGGAPGTDLTVFSPTELAVTAPPHAAGGVNVAVSGGYGTSVNTTADNYRYAPVPTIGSMTAETSVHGGQVRIEGRDLSNVSQAYFDGTPAKWVDPINTYEVFVGAPAHSPGMTHVTVSTPSGTSVAGPADLFLYSTENNDAWSSQRVTDSYRGQMDDISCPTASDCVAIDDATATTMSDGVWGKPVAVDPTRGVANTPALRALSCPTVDFCATVDAYGDVYDRIDGTWGSPQHIASTDYDFYDISCASSSMCMAVGSDYLLYRWSGGDWSGPLEGPAHVFAVSCVTTTFCVAAGGPSVYRWNGTAWSSGQNLVDEEDDFRDVSCASVSLCAAVDAHGYAVQWNGSNWSQPVQIFPEDWNGRHVSCSTAGLCAATDVAGEAAVLEGGSWHRSTGSITRPSTIDTPSEATVVPVACVSGTRCLGVDQAGDTITYDGSSWSAPVRTFATVGYFNDISCPTQDFCAAVDSDGNAAIERAGTWSAPVPVISDFGARPAISCTSATYCLMVSPSGPAARYDGAHWTTVESPPHAMTTISCVSSTLCMAPGADFDGAHWRTEPAPSIGGVERISCATADFCAAVSGDRSSIWDGTAWHATDNPADVVSCPAAGFCVATTTSGRTSTYRDGAWGQVTILPGDGQDTLACASATFCQLADEGANARTYDGAAWSARVSTVPDSGRHFVWTMSCAAPDVCTALGNDTVDTSRSA